MFCHLSFLGVGYTDKYFSNWILATCYWACLPQYRNRYIWIIFFAIIWLLPSILLTFFSVEVLDPGRINILLAFEVAVGFLSAGLLTNEIIGFREYIGAIFVVSA